MVPLIYSLMLECQLTYVTEIKQVTSCSFFKFDNNYHVWYYIFSSLDLLQMKSCLVNTGTLSDNNFYYLQSASNISNELNIIFMK